LIDASWLKLFGVSEMPRMALNWLVAPLLSFDAVNGKTVALEV
jgi:hypothetical protein